MPIKRPSVQTYQRAETQLTHRAQRLIDRMSTATQRQLLSEVIDQYGEIWKTVDGFAKRDARQMQDENLYEEARSGSLLERLGYYALEEDEPEIARARERVREAAIGVLMIERRLGVKFDADETLRAVVEQINENYRLEQHDEVAEMSNKLSRSDRVEVLRRAEEILNQMDDSERQEYCRRMRPLGGNPLHSLMEVAYDVALGEHTLQTQVPDQKLREAMSHIIQDRLGSMLGSQSQRH